MCVLGCHVVEHKSEIRRLLGRTPDRHAEQASCKIHQMVSARNLSKKSFDQLCCSFEYCVFLSIRPFCHSHPFIDTLLINSFLSRISLIHH